MTAKVLPIAADPHRSVQALLPWYVRGRLDRSERAEVDAHLAGCPRCQAELAWERELAAVPAPTFERGDAGAAQRRQDDDVDRGWAALRARIEASRGAPHRPPWPRLGLRWWQALLVAQFAALAALCVVLIAPRTPPQTYHALGAPARAAAAKLIVLFRPDATEREIRAALTRSGAQLVGGPTVTGAYLLELPAAGRADALAALRAQSIVVLAESLDAGPAP